MTLIPTRFEPLQKRGVEGNLDEEAKNVNFRVKGGAETEERARERRENSWVSLKILVAEESNWRL